MFKISIGLKDIGEIMGSAMRSKLVVGCFEQTAHLS
jgi:hypothetical protein